MKKQTKKVDEYLYKDLDKKEIEILTWAKNQIRKDYKEFIDIVKIKKMESDFELENKLAEIFD